MYTSARPVSRQGTVVFDPRVPATPRVPLRCVRYYDAKIRFRSTKTLCRAGSGVAHSGGLCTLASLGTTVHIMHFVCASVARKKVVKYLNSVTAKSTIMFGHKMRTSKYIYDRMVAS